MCAIQWDDSHETARRKNSWQLRRTPQRAKLDAWIVSETPLGVWTHYFGGKTMPCSGDSCKACQDDRSPRKHWYLACIEKNTGDRFLLELTDRGADGVIEAAANGASLRGRHIRTWRINSRPNGAVESNIGAPLPAHIKLPPQPDIRECLITIWGVDARAADADADETMTRVKPHWRRNERTNGPRTEKTPELPIDVNTGRPRSPDDVHQQPQQTRDLPPSAAATPTEPRAILSAAEIRNGKPRLEEHD